MISCTTKCWGGDTVKFPFCIQNHDFGFTLRQVFLRRFRDPIRVPRICNPVPRIRENYHRLPRFREIWSLQVHTGYIIFSLKKPALRPPTICGIKSLLQFAHTRCWQCSFNRLANDDVCKLESGQWRRTEVCWCEWQLVILSCNLFVCNCGADHQLPRLLKTTVSFFCHAQVGLLKS